MDTHRAYCAALDREVRVIVRPVCYDEMDPLVHEPPGIVCIEHAEECMGVRCPLFQQRAEKLEWFRHLVRR